MSDRTDRTAEELRTAAKKLRCEHRFPLQPPHGSFANPGPCRLCGTPYSDDEPTVSRALSEPLAVLLEYAARNREASEKAADEVGIAVERIDPLGSESVSSVALTVARVINGGEPR